MTGEIAALKIIIRGDVTSFRYPHFTQGFQPTYDMPPPSTIYGHLCSVLGRFLDPEELELIRFGYTFHHKGKFIDYMEHLHFDDPIQPFPFNRELLFDFRLTLYLTGLDLQMLKSAFANPYFTTVLGRSQDLVSYDSVEIVSLKLAKIGYLDHTLLPMTLAPTLSKDVIIATMARYIDDRRRVRWQPYAILRDTAIYPPQIQKSRSRVRPNATPISGEIVFEDEGSQIDLWIDPTSPTHVKDKMAYRLVVLHSFWG